MAQSRKVDPELSRFLIAGALNTAVGAFDGFGRETCRVFANKAKNPKGACALSFQNLHAARIKVRELFSVEVADGLTQDEWSKLVIGFQKRHVIQHKMGVADEQYVKRSGDPDAVVGRKVTTSEGEVFEVIRCLRIVGERLLAISK